MINGSDESYFRSFEGIVTWELSIQQEESIFIGSLFGTKKQYFPKVDIGTRVNSNERMRIFTVVLNFFGNSFETCISRYFLGLF